MLECPHGASSDLYVIEVEDVEGPALAVRCKECGAQGPRSLGNDRHDAVYSWNFRFGRLTVVK